MTHDARRLSDTGQIHVTLAAARSYADATGLGIEEARRELLTLLMDARLRDARDRSGLEQYRHRSRTTGLDVMATVSREDGMAVVVRIQVRGVPSSRETNHRRRHRD